MRYHEDVQMLAQVFQRGCEIAILGEAQNLSEEPVLTQITLNRMLV